MTTSQMQAQFEAWWARKDFPESMKASYYMAWHDSRAELVVVLPDKLPGFDLLGYAFNEGLDACRAAIESAGIPVKP